KRVVTFVCDSGNKYLSKMFNDVWMAEQGFTIRPMHGDLSDLILHRYEAGEVVTIGPTDTLLTAFKRMCQADVSQLPVVDESGRVVGIIDESDILVKVHRDASHFNYEVRQAMTDQLETLQPDVKRSEEHTSELQSLAYLVCRLLLDPTESSVYTLSLHDALPICLQTHVPGRCLAAAGGGRKRSRRRYHR